VAAVGELDKFGRRFRRCAGERRGAWWSTGLRRLDSGDVGGVPVEGGAGALVAHGGAWVGVAGGFLYVAGYDACVEGGGDEGVPEDVRADRLGDAGPFGDAAHDPAGAVPVQPLAVCAAEDRAVEAFADGQAEAAGRPRRQRDSDDLAHPKTVEARAFCLTSRTRPVTGRA
jgi:hypothetical protein